MSVRIALAPSARFLQPGSGLDIPRKHRLAQVIAEAMSEPMFAAQWDDDSDESFRPFAVAVFELRNAKRLVEATRRAIYRTLCTQQRIAVLADIFGKPIPKRVLKLLGRTKWKAFSLRDWNDFFSIAIANGTSELGHVPQVTSTLVRQYPLIPEELRLPGLMSVVSNLNVPADAWSRLRGFIHRAGPAQHAEFHRAAAAIRSRGDFWDLYFRCEGKYLLPFSIPALLSNSQLLVPIASPKEMVSEAIRMKNCLAKRISRVQSGNRIIFRLRDGTAVNAELVRRGQAWAPGDILGYQNSPVAPRTAHRIRVELQRLAKLISDTGTKSATREEDAYVAGLRQSARESFPAEDVARLATPLQSIRAKSRSWSNGAYTIFELKRCGYVQFMSSPDGKEYLLEICSHKYFEKVSDFLSADVVALIVRAGFVWPTGEGNFLRWFDVNSPKDIQAMAQIALAVLARVFGHRKGGQITVHAHIPA